MLGSCIRRQWWLTTEAAAPVSWDHLDWRPTRSASLVKSLYWVVLSGLALIEISSVRLQCYKHILFWPRGIEVFILWIWSNWSPRNENLISKWCIFSLSLLSLVGLIFYGCRQTNPPKQSYYSNHGLHRQLYICNLDFLIRHLQMIQGAKFVVFKGKIRERWLL